VIREYETVIGIEVHAQLLTRTKMFCGCAVGTEVEPNTNVCPVCLGHPGVLPVVNREAVTLAMRLVHAVGATVHERSVFARKNYFYPDLPKGYQISQFDRPLSTGGAITIDLDGASKEIAITRIHLEEDAGKSKHGDGDGGESLVDFNRVGTPLIEIVSEPDLRSPTDAVRYVGKLKQLVEYLGVCSGNMERGNFRCDANVSVRPRGQLEFGTLTEVKNLNSFRFLERALTFEADRQASILREAGEVRRATLSWDERRNATRLMRSKEETHDYRYFPEPDLPALVVSRQWREEVRSTLPELPDVRRARYVSDFGLRSDDAAVLTSSRELADYFETAASIAGDPAVTANWVQTEVLRVLNDESLSPDAFRVRPRQLGELVKLVISKEISGKIGKKVFNDMAESGEDARTIIGKRGLTPITDPTAIEGFATQVIEMHPDQVGDFLSGNDRVFQFLFGQLMRVSGGRIDPGTGQRVLREVLDRHRKA
jgi:aspartyl-tRNA(Asn)/glutamyl-tRNA(Gln) amidotransferase subunit B